IGLPRPAHMLDLRGHREVPAVSEPDDQRVEDLGHRAYHDPYEPRGSDRRGHAASPQALRRFGCHFPAPSLAAIRRNATGGSVPAALACWSAFAHQARSSRRIFAAALVRGSLGCPAAPKALCTDGMITLLRSGTISASIATCARCSMARMPPL